MTAELLSTELMLLVAIGFFAQLVDGALGMAFGVICTSAMLTIGVLPAQASAITHTAGVFTTAASGASHLYHGNVDWRLVSRLAITGVAGAVLGAWLLSNVDANLIRPFVAAYLLVIGLLILLRAVRGLPDRDASFSVAPPLGLVGGFLGASGGGGWGPVVSSTLIGSGHAPRIAVGSVNLTEFFVSAAAATTFFFELGVAPLQQLAALIVGGVAAAPFGGWMVKYIRPRLLMSIVGLLVIALAAWQMVRALKLV